MSGTELKPNGWMIHKAGRGWYRPDAHGYTSDPLQAGRFSHSDAMEYSHPNGPTGPRDGITIKHESEVPGAVASPPGDCAALPEVQALVAWAYEAAAKAVADSEFDHPRRYNTFSRLADRIRALTPADAIAARDAMIAEAVAKAFAEGRAAEREACAKVIETRAEEYDREHGAYDPSTGVTEYPGNGDELMEEWESCAAAIRKRGEG